MKYKKVGLFVRFAVALAIRGYFNLENDDLICLAEECLTLGQYLKLDLFYLFIIYHWLGKLYETAKRLKEALKIYEKQLKVAVQIGDQDFQATTCRNLGRLCNSLAKQSGSKKYKLGEGTAYVSLGGLSHSSGNYQEALENYKKGLNIAIEIGAKDHEVSACNGLGNAYRSLGKYSEAIKYYEKQLKVAVEIGNNEGEELALICLGDAHHILGKYQEAFHHHEKYLKIAIKRNDKQDEGIANNNLGNACQSLGKYEEAVKYHQRYLDIALQRGDKKGEGTANSNLGKAFYCLGKHQKAMKYHQRHLDIALQNGDKRDGSAAYVRLGVIHHSLGNYQEALKYYEKGLNILIEMDDKELEMCAFNGLGNTYHSLGKYNEAIIYHEKHLKIAVEIGDEKNEGIAYSGLGIAYQSLGKYPEAFSYHERYLNIALKIGDKDGEGTSYENIGKTYLLVDKYEKAIKYLEKALKIAMDTGNKNTEGRACCNMGVAFQSLDRYNDAIEYHKRALTIATEMGNRNLEKSACGGLGTTYKLLGKYHEAIKYHERSLKIATETSDKVAEGGAYGNLGIVYNLQGKYYDAILYYESALKISKETGDKSSEAISYGNLGDAFKTLGKSKEAIKYTEKYLDIAIQIKDKNAQGTAYGNFGRVYQSLGRFQEAIDYFSKQLNVALEMDDKRMEGYACGNLGNAHMALRKFEDSIKYHEKHLMITKQIGDKRDEGRAYARMGEIYRLSGEYHKAIELYEKCLNTARDIGDKDGEGKGYNKLGLTSLLLALTYKEAYDQENYLLHMKKCESYLKEGVKCYEWIFGRLQQQDELKISIVDTFIYAYRMLTFALIETQQIEEALLVSERGRARALSDHLILKYNLSENNNSNKGDDPKVKIAELENFLSQSNFCVLFFVLNFNTAAYWVLAHQKPLVFQEREIKGLTTSLTGTDQKEEMATYPPKVIYKAYDKMNVREGLKCEDRSFRSFDSVSGHLNGEQEPKKATRVVKEEDNSGNSATNARCIPDEDIHDLDDTNPLEILFDGLIAPAVHNLTEDEVVIVPDGPLNMVPFAALTDPKTGLFLSETKRIRLAPSLAALKVLQECPVDHHSQKGALIVGGPDIGEVMFRGEKRSFFSLPFAKYEAEKISDVLGVTPLIGSQATKEAVIQRLREGLAVIHFAAHGSENGEILLAPSVSSASRSTPEEEDYILTVKEVQENGIRAQLVVLSCCHSGRGEIKAEGVVGMSRAFLAAGARAVVASLWAIEDEATKVFMLNFYSQLKRGETASASLQQAMKEMRETERHREPKYWASFFLIGDNVKICLDDDEDCPEV